MKIIAMSAICLAALVSSPAFARPSSELKTSICQLLRHEKQYDGRYVRLTAVYETDLQEHSSLSDRRCPNFYVAPYDSHVGPTDGSLAAFDKALIGRFNDLSLRRFIVDLSGQFSLRTGDTPHGAVTIYKIWSYKRLSSHR